MSNWLFQANPARYDVLTVLASGKPIEAWSIGRHYRDLIQGDRAALWVGGRRDPGIYALGWVDGDPGEGLSSGDWSRPQDRHRRMMFCPLSLDRILFPHPIPRHLLLQDTRFASARIVTQPQAANPFLLTDDEWAAIEDLLRRRPRQP